MTRIPLTKQRQSDLCSSSLVARPADIDELRIDGPEDESSEWSDEECGDGADESGTTMFRRGSVVGVVAEETDGEHGRGGELHLYRSNYS